MKSCCLQNGRRSASGYLQNWEMGASIWAEAPPLELSFWTWVGGTGLWDWPVARYMAWTHRMRSCSSSLANITVSPSFTALKNARPPSKPAATAPGGGGWHLVSSRCACVLYRAANKGRLTWLRVTVVHGVTVQLQQLLRFGLLLSVAAHGERVLANLQRKGWQTCL